MEHDQSSCDDVAEPLSTAPPSCSVQARGFAEAETATKVATCEIIRALGRHIGLQTLDGVTIPERSLHARSTKLDSNPKADWRVIAMTHDKELRYRESARRKALLALASLSPGDPKALDVLDVLDDIELSETNDTSMPASVHSVKELRNEIPTEPHPIGCRIVREESIPQPWRERFLRASLGSTRVAEGTYAHDWEKFLNEWEREMNLLQAHRAARTIHE